MQGFSSLLSLAFFRNHITKVIPQPSLTLDHPESYVLNDPNLHHVHCMISHQVATIHHTLIKELMFVFCEVAVAEKALRFR